MIETKSQFVKPATESIMVDGKPKTRFITPQYAKGEKQTCQFNNKEAFIDTNEGLLAIKTDWQSKTLLNAIARGSQNNNHTRKAVRMLREENKKKIAADSRKPVQSTRIPS